MFVKMSKSQTLRVLVNERLTAAAEEIFALFERTIAEYEEKLRENQREQRLLETVLNPRDLLPRAGAGIQALGPELNPENPEPAGIKEEPEEQSIKQEEEQLSVSFQDLGSVKTEDSSLFTRQTGHRDETQEEDISSTPHFHTETVRQVSSSSIIDINDGNCERLLICSDAQMETETGGDHYNQVQVRARSAAAQNSGLSPEHKSAPEISAPVNSRDMSRTDKGAERKKYQCYLCMKRFSSNLSLQMHIRVHTGEKPYRCTICEKTFNQKGNFDRHKRLHTGERPYSCTVCNKTFADKSNFVRHRRTHTDQRHYGCTECKHKYTDERHFDQHRRIHTNEKPLQLFSNKISLSSSVRNHMSNVGYKPYS